ncbi:hypothetical protein PMZ80_007060 [Knufia obscura]|uniref:2-hydroxyacyl-CoA lyase n=2 Tax=Knufia TaxID=430999 RepID=A0AAN8EDH6_9EURO|nr:hypothetical protein PMZ80_007060 [Knufia obscura]KAK5953069.1 hypothetical protein OHC33_005637 [Knufia fluminis]
MTSPLGAKVIAQALHDLGVTVIFGLVGLPVTDIAEQAIDLGIRFIGFRNEQACSYAATAYGYLTGKPGVCLLVGGPGVIHGMAGIANASANAWPTLFLGGSSETSQWTKGGFQEMDAIALLTPHTKRAIRPHTNSADAIVTAIHDAYRVCWYGRPGPTFVDLPTDFIMTPVTATGNSRRRPVLALPKPAATPDTISAAVELLKHAKAPLVIIGKGAAYARAEQPIRALVNSSKLPFLPTPMGKGVVPDSHPLNTSSARSVALREADVIILLGARLNWILHFAASPKYRKDVKIIQVDISPEELGRSNSAGQPALSIFGDISTVVDQLNEALRAGTPLSKPSFGGSGPTYLDAIRNSALKNESKARTAANTQTRTDMPLTFERAFHIIKETLHSISAPENGDVVYIGEGSQTMDISRSVFPLEHPRQKLDAGTYATMGVGLAYCVAAWSAYNLPRKTKKIVALEGDSALGFAAMEIETMRRHEMDVLIFCMNNSGIYSGDTADAADWKAKQARLLNSSGSSERRDRLKSSSLMHEARYEQLAEMVGGRGIFVKTEEELEKATKEGYAEGRVTVVNVIIEPGNDKNISFAWMEKKAEAKM